MEIQDLSDLYRKLKQQQIQLTTSYLYENIGRHKTLLDLSNKYLFDSCILKLKKILNSSYTTHIPIRSLILQNCLLTASSACSVLSTFSNFPGRININLLDLGNNSIVFTPSLSLIIVKLFEKSGKNEGKKLKIQGNIIPDAESISPVLKSQLTLDLLTLYDCFLQTDSILLLSEAISNNKNIYKLDLSYNQSGFNSIATIKTLGVSLGINTQLISLKLNGIQCLSNQSILSKLCLGLKHSPSLQKLSIGSIPLNDSGLKILRDKCLSSTSITYLDIQNNNISAKAFIKFLSKCSNTLNTLIACYNAFHDNKAMLELGKGLIKEKALRVLNLSYCFNLVNAEGKALSVFCKGITLNRSLCEMVLEGCKIENDPDEFCRMISEAIEERKYPIAFKISAVKSFEGKENAYLSKTNDRILKDLTE